MRENQITGKGILIKYEQGEQVVLNGHFNNGVMYDYGETSTKSYKESGVYVNGKLNGNGEILSKDQEVIGAFHNGKYHGEVKITSKD